MACRFVEPKELVRFQPDSKNVYIQQLIKKKMFFKMYTVKFLQKYFEYLMWETLCPLGEVVSQQPSKLKTGSSNLSGGFPDQNN